MNSDNTHSTTWTPFKISSVRLTASQKLFSGVWLEETLSSKTKLYFHEFLAKLQAILKAQLLWGTNMPRDEEFDHSITLDWKEKNVVFQKHERNKLRDIFNMDLGNTH